MSDIVLLTGATGFVGRQVLRALIVAGRPVRIVVRAGQEAEFAGQSGIESVIGTTQLFVESADWWANVCKDVDIVIHVAWYAEPGKYLHSALNLDCLTGTLQLAKGAVQAGVRRFIGIGTCFEYDLTPGYLAIDTPLRPLTPYAGAKAAAFLALSQCLPQQQVEFAWCRLFYLYGDGEDTRRLVPFLRDRLAVGEPVELTRGNQVRDFLDVAEAGRMIVAAALSEVQGAINICSGLAITVRELAERIADEYGPASRALLKFGARPDNLIDPPCVVGIRLGASA